DDLAPQRVQPPHGQMPDQQQAIEVLLLTDATLLQSPAPALAVGEDGFDARPAGVLAHPGPPTRTGAEQDPPLLHPTAPMDRQGAGPPARILEDLHRTVPTAADLRHPVPQPLFRPPALPGRL